MKYILFLCITSLAFTSCNSQKNKAMQEQQKAYDILKSLPGGAIATAEGSWTMTATIDGKPWKTNYMYPPEASGRIIGHYNNEFIGLPYMKTDMVVGKKETFSEDNATDLFLENDDNGFYGGRQGGMVITKVNGDWVEGTFHFVANTINNKTVNVTNGFFRIKMQ